MELLTPIGVLGRHTDFATKTGIIWGMRLPWPRNFPPLFSHVTWAELQKHPKYDAAKRNGDVEAALDLIDDIAELEILDDIVDCIRNEKTLVLAPSLTPENNKNALSIGYAAWLARELDLETCKSIFQVYRPKKDRLGFWA